MGSGPALLGHAHPAITEAVSAQLPKGTTYYFLNEQVVRLAERLVEAVPCAEQVQFAGSGTEATFFALRVARSLTGRTKIMKLEGGWHGMHDYALWGTVPSAPSDYPRAEPDLATYGKAMAGGFPMACIGGKAEMLAPLDARRTERTNLAWASGTLNGNPVSASAGNAALDVLSRPGTYEGLSRIGGRLRAGIDESGRRHGFPTQALGEDAVFGVRFIDGPRPKTWMDLQKHDRELGLEWGLELLRRGLLVNPNEKFYISIAHTDADVDQTLEVVDGAFKVMAAKR